MKLPEVIMGSDWPHPHTRRRLLSGADIDHPLRLYWPVSYLPERMGWLPTAEHLAEDHSGAYFLEVEVTCFEDGLDLYGVKEQRDGSHPWESLSYEEIAHLIAARDTTVRTRRDPPPAMPMYTEAMAGRTTAAPPAGVQLTRRYAGRLHMVEVGVSASLSTIDDDALPF